ncbi:NUDIX domain-containing protein [Lyngbya aestuarii]|uniref:NUDIX domain-containing protein n=1 Tax=Lyngbya aestuarii TaxID=118322 RepID=UPI00403DF862
MGQPKQKIRVIVLGLIKNGDRTLLSEGYDPVKQETFYRALGGGVDFGETSYDALKREFQEELQTELVNIKYLECIESLFIFNGRSGHEIIQLYQCDFADQKLYQLDELEFVEGDSKKKAVWVDIEQCKSGKLRVVPEKFLDYI